MDVYVKFKCIIPFSRLTSIKCLGIYLTKYAEDLMQKTIKYYCDKLKTS